MMRMMRMFFKSRDTSWMVLCIAVYIAAIGINPTYAALTSETQLVEGLLYRYQRLARPISSTNQTVHVFLRLFFLKIHDIIEKDEMIETMARLQVHWKDDRLRWDPKNYDGIKEIPLPSTKIWIPDIQLFNSATDFYSLTQDTKFNPKVHYDGSVWWHPTGNFFTRCELKLKYFPFDYQICEYVFESGFYTSDKIMILMRRGKKPIDFMHYISSGKYQLTGAGGLSYLKNVSSSTRFSGVAFLVRFQRKTVFYALNILLPLIILAVLQLTTFFLPAGESGNSFNDLVRVQQSTTILLAVVVFQTIAIAELPRISDSVPLLCVYVGIITLLSALVITESIAVGCMRRCSRPAPEWLSYLLNKIHGLTPEDAIRRKLFVREKRRLKLVKQTLAEGAAAAPPPPGGSTVGDDFTVTPVTVNRSNNMRREVSKESQISFTNIAPRRKDRLPAKWRRGTASGDATTSGVKSTPAPGDDALCAKHRRSKRDLTLDEDSHGGPAQSDGAFNRSNNNNKSNKGGAGVLCRRHAAEHQYTNANTGSAVEDEPCSCCADDGSDDSRSSYRQPRRAVVQRHLNATPERSALLRVTSTTAFDEDITLGGGGDGVGTGVGGEESIWVKSSDSQRPPNGGHRYMGQIQPLQQQKQRSTTLTSASPQQRPIPSSPSNLGAAGSSTARARKNWAKLITPAKALMPRPGGSLFPSTSTANCGFHFTPEDFDEIENNIAEQLKTSNVLLEIIKYQWRRIASLCDKFLFVLFLFITTVTPLVMFVWMPEFSPPGYPPHHVDGIHDQPNMDRRAKSRTGDAEGSYVEWHQPV